MEISSVGRIGSGCSEYSEWRGCQKRGGSAHTLKQNGAGAGVLWVLDEGVLLLACGVDNFKI